MWLCAMGSKRRFQYYLAMKSSIKNVRKKCLYGAVHKVRHAIFGQFLPLSPCHTSSHIPEPPESTSHISDPRFLLGLVQKTRTKAPCTNSVWIFRGVFCHGGFVRGSFVWKVLSGVVFVRSPSVRIHLFQQKVKHHFEFHVSYVW